VSEQLPAVIDRTKIIGDARAQATKFNHPFTDLP
jgi:hypothetical protein